MRGFWQHILAWNPDHTGDTPPHHPELAALLLPTESVPTTFRDVHHYVAVMLPLFLQEVWAQMKSYEQGNNPTSFAGPTMSLFSPTWGLFSDFETRIPKITGLRLNNADLMVLRGPDSKPIFAQATDFRKSDGMPPLLSWRTSAVVDGSQSWRTSAVVDQPKSGLPGVRWLYKYMK
jgi:senataxin